MSESRDEFWKRVEREIKALPKIPKEPQTDTSRKSSPSINLNAILWIVISLLFFVSAFVYWGGKYRKHSRSVEKWESDMDLLRFTSPTVYVTNHGTNYHTSRHYADKSESIKLIDASVSGFHRCSVCGPPERMSYPNRPNGYLVIFPYGGFWLLGSLFILAKISQLSAPGEK